MTEKELEEILKRNPELRIVEDWRLQERPSTHAGDGKGKGGLVEAFIRLWEQLGGQALSRELRFDPVRRWRFDFAHEASRVAIEINGGVWSGGRHVRGAGYLRDREKMNAAQAAGWRVFELGTGQVTAGNLLQIIETINSICKERES